MNTILFGAMLIFLGVLAGCFQWSEDANGNLQSVGQPGAPVWQSKNPPAPSSPSETVITPAEAERIKSGPVLVTWSADGTYNYRSYEPGQNHCEEDLKRILDARAVGGATGPAPYCAIVPVGQVKSRGAQGVVW